MYEEAVSRATASLGPDHLQVDEHQSAYVPCLTRLGRYQEAEAQLLTAHEKLQASRGEQHWQTNLSLRRLIELYEAWGKSD